MKKIFFLLFLAVSFACTNVGFTTDCSNHGVCAFDQRIGATRCVCDSGWTGTICMTSVTTAESLAPATATATSAIVQTTTTAVTTPLITVAPTVAPTMPSTITTTLSKNRNCVDEASKDYPKKICSGHGICEENPDAMDNHEKSYCVCEAKYIGTYCEKDQKTKGIAAVLEFFVGAYGASEFYLGYTALGVIKILLGVFGCCGAYVAACMGFACANNEQEGAAGCAMAVCGVFVCLCFTASSIWVIVQFIMILAGAVNDANGNPLYNGFKK